MQHECRVSNMHKQYAGEGGQEGCFASAKQIFLSFFQFFSTEPCLARACGNIMPFIDLNGHQICIIPLGVSLGESDTPLKFPPGAKKREGSERARMIDLVHDKYFYVFPAT